jgi:glycosyltransferase involved in cell wall biosynthesis
MSFIKVVHLIASNGIGGAENVLLDICRSLESERVGFEVCLFVLPGKERENALGRLLKEHGIPIRFIEMHFPLSPSEIINLTRIFRKAKPSIIHCHGLRADVFGGIAAKLCRIPAVSSVHGLVPFSRKMRFYTWLDLKSLALFDMVLPVSAKLEEELRQNGLPPSKIQLLPNVPARNGHGSARVRTTLTDKVGVQIGFVGRLSPEKGVLLLLDAAAGLKGMLPFSLHIVGDGPEMVKVVARVRELDLEGCVKIHGYLANPYDIYEVLDILVLPSLTEGTPLTLLEGMSMGLPIIASEVGGVPEIIEDQKNGITVQPGLVPELTGKMLLLARDPMLRKKLGNAALESIAVLCDHDRWERQILQVYKTYRGNRDTVS